MRTPHDRTYKLLHSDPRIVESFLREHGIRVGIPHYMHDVFDYGTLRREPSDSITSALGERFGDRLWRITPSAKGTRGLPPQMRRFVKVRKGKKGRRGRTAWRHVYLLFEFQSTIDPYMAARIEQYVQLLHEELIRRGELQPGDELPLVIPIVMFQCAASQSDATGTASVGAEVLYNPDTRADRQRWISPIEALRAKNLDPTDWTLCTGYFLVFGVHSRRVRMRDLGDGLFSKLVRLDRSTSIPKAVRILEDIFKDIQEPHLRRLRRAFYLRARVLKFWTDGLKGGPSFDTLEEAFIGGTMVEVVESIYERGMREARQEGISLERKESLVRERKLLRLLTTMRFGSEVADRLTAVIDRIDDPKRLEDIGDLIVSVRTGSQLLKRIERSAT